MKPNYDPGTVSEYKFAARAVEEGFTVCWPSSQMLPIDFTLINDSGKVKKVQVKSTAKKHKKGYYHIKTAPDKGRYRKTDIDFLAAYCKDIDTWYIIPFKQILDKKAICIRSRSFIKYKENWKQFK